MRPSRHSLTALAFVALTLAPAGVFGWGQAKPPAQEKQPEKPAAAAEKQPEKVTLVYKAQAGQVGRYRTEATLNIEAGGNKVRMEQTETEKVTFKSVDPSGDITVERVTESSEMKINGATGPSEDEHSTYTQVIHPNGVLVSMKSDKGEPEQVKMQARLYPTSTPIFTDKPVGVGDKWSYDFKADTTLGTHAGHGDYEVLAFEKVAGVDTVKIKLTYKETESKPAVGATGTFWVEKSSGDTVSADGEIENVSFGDAPGSPVASGKMHAERQTGGPLAGTPDNPNAKKDKDIDETVKDYEKLSGVFPIYRKREAGRDTVYMEVRENQLDKLFMLEATASTGTSDVMIAGMPIDDLLLKFVKKDERLFLVTPNIAFRAKEKTPIARSLERSFADGYLEAYKIEAKQASRKSLLINVSDLFRGDIANISQQLRGYSMDRDKTFITAIKNFPENLVVETQYHFNGSRGGGNPLMALLNQGSAALADPRSLPLKVNYTLFFLPDNGYKPRLADPRVGYFTVDSQSFDDDSRDEAIDRYILRWDIEKADPKAAMSPPKKPIVFWLDNAIPEEYRPAVRDGLLFWNKAFEKVGIKDAIVVKQMPDNADWDHADMRYNTIRWVLSPDSGYAVALFRTNPITGQILNANITVDANLVRFTKLEKKILVEPSSYFEGPKAIDPAKLANPRKLLAQCDMAQEAVEQAWFGYKLLDLIAPQTPGFDSRPYIQNFLRMVVSHEMGHIMGLRHNFIASTYHSMDELGNRDLVHNTGVSASVMDYIPFNLPAIKARGVDYFNETIGPYDMWAIQYGYTTIDAATPVGELSKLKQIASRCNEPGLGYQSDEIADQFDPAVTRFDLGRDPLAYWDRMLQTSRYLMFNLDKREPKKGQSYWEYARDFNRLLGVYARSASVATRYVGGLHANRNFKGDPGEKPALAPVDGAEQKKALGLLNTYIFAQNAFKFPTAVYTKLGIDPYAPDFIGMLTGESQQTYPMRDRLSGIQTAALRRLFSTAVLRSVANNEFKTDGDSNALRLISLFNSVGDTVWSELGTHNNISALRRQLQRAHLETMIGMLVSPAGGTPEDAKMLAWDQLRKLKTRIASDRSSALDDYTRVHLDESLMRINRALDAKMTIGGSSASRPMSLLQLLGGEESGQGGKVTR